MPPISIFVDQFPCDPAAPNFEEHEKIDAELSNCRSLWPHATMGQLFPGCVSASAGERARWLSAAMERVEWHCGKPDDQEWLLYLTCMLRMLVRDAGHLDDLTLLRLAKFGPRLHSNQGGAAHFHDLAPVVAKALSERKAPLSTEIGACLQSLVDHLVSIHDHAASTFDIAFRLFRAGWSHIPWADARDFQTAGWKALLDLSNHSWQSPGPSPKQAVELRRAIAAIGASEVAAQMERAVDRMVECQPAALPAAGMTLLRQMLCWVLAQPELAVDETLYRLCGVRWDPAAAQAGLMKEWVGTLLHALASRGRDRAFACVELLGNNPDTKNFLEVARLYEQLMSEMLLDVPSERRTSPDGFPSDSRMHQILDGFERASVPATPTEWDPATQSTCVRTSEHFQIALRQCRDDYPAMLRAMNERVQWLSKHEPPAVPGQGREMPWLAWCCDLGRLYCKILEQKPDLTAQDLTALCKVDALGWLGVAPSGLVLNACERWISKNGFDPELTAAMTEWQKSVFGGGTAMALRKQIGWLLWFDTAAPVNEKTCWSAVIRKDLRTMPPKVKGAWIALLHNICLSLAEKPTKKWLKPAEKLLAQVGPREFQLRIREWFAPFKAGGALKITVAGRDILGALFWYSQLAKDPQVDEAVRWFATAKWKAKADRDRTARLLPVWIDTMVQRCPESALNAIHAYKATGQLDLMGTSMKMYDELCRRFQRTPQIAAPPPPPPIDKQALMSKAMQKVMSTMLGNAAQINGDIMLVENQDAGERYEIGLRDGRIVRMSDGKTVRLEVDWSRPPFSPFKSMIDAGDLADPFGRNYLRAMLCAQLLSGALPLDVPVVVDES